MCVSLIKCGEQGIERDLLIPSDTRNLAREELVDLGAVFVRQICNQILNRLPTRSHFRADAMDGLGKLLKLDYLVAVMF